MIDNENGAEITAKFINSLNKIFCNKECCADYIRFLLNKPNDIDSDDLDENIVNNIELVKKSANKNYEETTIHEKVSDAPKPEEFLNGGKFSGLPDEIKSAYLEKYFEIIDGDKFNYQKSFLDNLGSMLDKYQNYPEGVFLHILRLRLKNFEEKQKQLENKNEVNEVQEDFRSKKNLATAIKQILDSSNFGIDEKKLAVLWEYYEYFNGIDENEELDNQSQNKVEQLKETLEKIIGSDDFKKHKKSSLIQSVIITGKLKTYKIDTNFKKEYVNVLANYNDTVKIAVIEAFEFVQPLSRKTQSNLLKIDDLCNGTDDKNLSLAVRAKMIEKLNSEVKGIFDSAEFDKFACYLMKTYQIDVDNVDSEILVALFKFFLNSNPAIGANMTQVLTAISEIQKQTNNFKKQVDLNSRLLSQLSHDLGKDDLKNKIELVRQFKAEQRQLRNARLKKNIVHFFGKILFCLVFFIVAIPTLLIRWTLRFLWGILGWFINMFYFNWKEADSIGQGFKNFCFEFFGFFFLGFVGAVTRRIFISDTLGTCQIFKNLWYRFFGNANDVNNHQVYVSGFKVQLKEKIIDHRWVKYRNENVFRQNFDIDDYFKFMSGYSEIINESEVNGYPGGKIPLQSKLENINTKNSSPFRYY